MVLSTQSGVFIVSLSKQCGMWTKHRNSHGGIFLLGAAYYSFFCLIIIIMCSYNTAIVVDMS